MRRGGRESTGCEKESPKVMRVREEGKRGGKLKASERMRWVTEGEMSLK